MDVTFFFAGVSLRVLKAHQIAARILPHPLRGSPLPEGAGREVRP